MAKTKKVANKAAFRNVANLLFRLFYEIPISVQSNPNQRARGQQEPEQRLVRRLKDETGRDFFNSICPCNEPITTNRTCIATIKINY